MITSIGQSIDALKEEYGLDRDLIIEAMKDAGHARWCFREVREAFL